MSLVLYGASSTNNMTFNVRSSGDRRVEMVEGSSTMAEPMILTQTLAIKGPGVSGNNRWNGSISSTFLDTNLVPHTLGGSVQLSIPKSTSLASTAVGDMCSMLASLLGAAKAYGTNGTVVSGCTDTSAYPAAIAKCQFVGL